MHNLQIRAEERGVRRLETPAKRAVARKPDVRRREDETGREGTYIEIPSVVLFVFLCVLCTVF